MAVTIFLRLTDYVSGSELCELSPEVLQTIVCGADGFKLERIRQMSGAQILRFVSAPFPGFYVKGNTTPQVSTAARYIDEILRDIRKAASDVTASTCSNSSKTAPAKARRSPPAVSFKNAFYHPLYSASQYHLMPALLPTPTVHSPQSPQPLSEKDCERILSSPYLEGIKQRSSPKATVTFDKELEGCLPGVPGVRQSKEYKRIRRKISEIDDLVTSGVTLDVCQKSKVGRRAEYVSKLREMLLNGIPEKPPVELVSPSLAVQEEPVITVAECSPRIEPPPPTVKTKPTQPKKKVVTLARKKIVEKPLPVEPTVLADESQHLAEYIITFLGLIAGLAEFLLSVLGNVGSSWLAFLTGEYDTERPAIPRKAKAHSSLMQ